MKCNSILRSAISSFLIVFFLVACQKNVLQLADTSQVLVQKDQLALTEAKLKDALLARPAEVKNAVLSNAKRFHKFVENRWIELNLIDQYQRGAKPGDMPDFELLDQLVHDTTLAKLTVKKLAEQDKVGIKKQVRRHYKKNPQLYQLPDKVNAAHILISRDNHEPEAGRQLAETVRAEVLAGKLSFAELANKYSEDPSAKTNQGDLGFFVAGQMAKPFEDAAFAMSQPGDISPVIETSFGYHVIQFKQRKSGQLKAFKSVADDIRKTIIQQRQQKRWLAAQQKLPTDLTTLVSQQEAIAWLWYAGIKDKEVTADSLKTARQKLALAQSFVQKAKKTKYDKDAVVKAKLAQEQRSMMVKLRRKALFQEVAKRDFSAVTKEHYMVKKAQMLGEPTADLSVVFFPSAQTDKEQANALAQKAYQQLSNGEITFAALLAEQQRLYPNNQRTAQIEASQPNQLKAAVAQAVFSDNKARLLPPVVESDGVSLIQVKAYHPPRQLSYDEVKISLTADIISKQLEILYANLVQEIIHDPAIKINDPALDALYQALIK